MSKQSVMSRYKKSTATNINEQTKDIRRYVIVKEHWDTVESPSDTESDDIEELASFQKDDLNMQYEYWTILKTMKFLRLGDQKASISAMACMLTFDLQSPQNMFAIVSQGGLETLVNITETNDVQCRIGSLLMLEELCKVKTIAARVVDLGICPMLAKRLIECMPDMVSVAAGIIAKIGFLRKASTSLRLHGTIEVLVSHLTVTKEVLLLDQMSLTEAEKTDVKVSIKVAHALWSLARFTKNKFKMLKTGIVKIMSNIILSGHKEISIPMIGTLCDCSTEFLFQCAVETEGLVGILVKDILSEEVELQQLCALALSRAASGNETVREMIRFHNGPKYIMQLITNADKDNKPLVTAGISALWKSALSEGNVKEFERLDAVPTLIDFLDETHVEVLVATVGAIGEMAKSDTARLMIINKGAMTEIISLLGHINEELLANAAHAVGVCADCDEGIEMLDRSDGLRLLWSLLKNSSNRVKVQALWAVKPCVARHPDSGEMIRSLMGSLTLIVKMLLHKDMEVLAAVCAVISEVALDLENLAVMTEQGVVNRLSALIIKEKRETTLEEVEKREMKGREGVRYVQDIKRTQLQCELASVIANCSTLADNRRAFGRAGIIPIIVDYLTTTSPVLLAQACRALHALSQDNFNCVTIQSCGGVPHLLTAVESRCKVTQIGAAGTLKNIRKMMIVADKKKLAFDCLPRPERLKKLKEIDAIVRVLSEPRAPEEDKEALTKGLPRPTLKAMSLIKAKAKMGSKGSSQVMWVDSHTASRGVMKKQSSLLSWRERLTIFSETAMLNNKQRRHDEMEAVLAGKAAASKGGKAVSLGTQGSMSTNATPASQ